MDSNNFTPDETATILDSIADGVFTVDGNFTITSFNRAAEDITGVPRDEALGRNCCEVFRADICEGDCALKHTTRTGQSIVNRSITILRSDGTRIPISVSTALLRDGKGGIIGGVESFRDLTLVQELRKKMEDSYTFADIISRNQEMKDIFSILPDVAESGSTVLIEGESGTGKELLAKAIHNLSPRAGGPPVTVNCSAIPDALLESELFGYKSGAFTDAKKDKPGRFTLAAGGTIFLDEIGDITPSLQVKLLRVLQEKIVEPLGSTAPIPVDIRIIAATNKDLKVEMEEKRFRPDLYYRINVIAITLPPLRERKEDIPLLARHIIERLNRLRGKDITGLSDDSMGILLHQDWQGNVRELENVIEYAFILCPGGLIEPRHLPKHFQSGISAGPSPEGDSMADIESRAIMDALARNGWNRTAAARSLGLDRTTIWRKIRRLGLKVPKPGRGDA